MEQAVEALKDKDLDIQEAIEALVKLYNDIWWVERRGINNGLCEDFSWALCDLIEGATSHWGNELLDATATVTEHEIYGHHCFTKFEGRYYDSEEPLGVDDFRDLPIYLELRML